MDLSPRLTRWFFRQAADFGRNWIKPSSKTSIIDLPVDILLLVVAKLEWHDRFLLSQTNSVLRRVTSCNWGIEISRLSRVEKFDFFTGLVYALPDRYACGTYFRLHAVDQLGAPRPQSLPCCSLVQCGNVLGYSIQHRHVQLALKYTRLQIHQSFLNDVLASYGEPFRRDRLYSAQPRIIKDRFILGDQWIFRNGLKSITQEYVAISGLSVCPHAIFDLSSYPLFPPSRRPSYNWFPQAQQPTIDLERIITTAFDNPGRGIEYWCTVCPTDYIVLVTPSLADAPAVATFRAWHDLGSHSSPIDPIWTSHQRGYDIYPSKMSRVYHVPGSVRELWWRDGS